MNRENKRKTFEKGYYKTHPCHDSFTCKVCGRLVTPAPTGGEQQDQRQHPPHAELPPGGELIPKEGLDGQQQRRRTGGGEGLEEKGPEIGHRAQTSISSNSFLSRSRSWGEMGSSFRKAATRSPAEPW